MKKTLLNTLLICITVTLCSNVTIGADGKDEARRACTGPATLTTPSSAAIGTTTATLGGTITTDGTGGCTLSDWGIKWSTTVGQAAASGTLVSKGGTPSVSAFTTPVTGLPAGTTIYYVAYATNENSTGYTTESSFTTLASATFSTATNGLTSALVASQADQAIIGFSFSTTGGQTATGAVFTFNTDTATLKLKNFELVESNDNTFDAGDAVIASHSNTKLVGTSSTVITVSSIVAVSTKWYFLRADVDPTATSNTFNITLTSATISAGVISNSSPYFSNSGVTISPITATLAQQTGGVSDPVLGGDTNKAFIGFNFTTNLGQTVTGATFTFSTDTATLGLENFELVESNDATFDVADAVIASHSNGLLTGTSSTVITVSGISAVATKYYFLRADVDIAAVSTTFNLALTSATVGTGTISNSSPYFTKSNIDIDALEITISQQTGGTSDPIAGNDNDKALIGFSFTTPSTQTITGAVFTFSIDTATLKLKNFELVESNDATFDGADAVIAKHSNGTLVGTSSTVITISGINATSTKYYFLRADVDPTATANTFNLQFTSATVNTGSISNSSPYFTKSNIDIQALTATIVQRAGGTSDPLAGNDSNKAIIGFSFTSTGSQNITGAVFTFNTDTATLKLKNFELWESNSATYPGTGSVVAKHSDGTLVGTSSTVLTISGITAGPSTANKYYFLIADVDPTATANIFNVQFTSATVDVGNITTAAPYFTKSNIDIIALVATIADLNNSGANGVVATSMTGNASSQPIFGFSLTSTGAQDVSLIKINFDADPALFYTNFVLVKSTNANADATGNTTVSLSSANVSGTGPWVLSIDPTTDITLGATQNFFLFADVIPGVSTGTDLIQASMTSADITIVGGVGSKTGSATGIDYDFVGLTTTFLQLTNGVSSGGTPLVAGTGSSLATSTNAILGFSLQSNGAQTANSVKIAFDSNPTGKFTAIGLRSSTDNTFSGGDALVATTGGSTVTGSGPYYITLNITSPIDISTIKYLFVVASVNGNTNSTTASITPSLSSADVTLNPTNISANTVSGQTYTFSASNASTIDFVAASNSSNIAFGTYSTNTASVGTTLTNANSIVLGQFTLKDGGGSADSDTQKTSVTSLTLSITNPGDLNTIAIFNGNAASNTNLGQQIAAGTLTFTVGLPTLSDSITAADDGSQIFTVRATFNPLLGQAWDNNTHVVAVTAATTATTSAFSVNTGSSLSASGLSAATTGSSGTTNNITVTATKVIFNPSAYESNPKVGFAITASGTDANNNIDYNATGAVTLSISGGPSGGFYTGSDPVSTTPTLGVYTWDPMLIELSGTYVLTGNHATFTGGNDAVGSIFIESLGPSITSIGIPTCRVGTNKYYAQLDTLVLSERDPADFNIGTDKTFLIILPGGWEFLTPGTTGAITTYTPPGISISTATGSNFLATPVFSGFIGSTVAKFTWTVDGVDEYDTLSIRGLFVRNVDATAIDSVFRSGSAIIEGIDETVNLGTLTIPSELPVDFTVLNQQGNPSVDPSQTEFSIKEPAVILVGKVGTKTFDPDTVSFFGNGVSLKAFFGSSDKYVFSPSAVTEGDIPITMTYRDTLNYCLSDITKIFKVYDKAIQGLADELCINDTTAYALSVNVGDIPPGYSVDPTTPFKYQDSRFNVSMSLTPSPISWNGYANSNMVFYSGGSPVVSWPPPLTPKPNITSITWNPTNPDTGLPYSKDYSYLPYWGSGQFYGWNGSTYVGQTGPVSNLTSGYYYYFGTSFVQLTIPAHGLTDGDKIYVNNQINGFFYYSNSGYDAVYFYPYYNYTVNVVDGNNVIINLFEVYGYGPDTDGVSIYGYMYGYMNSQEPYNLTTSAAPNLDTQIDITIPGHTLVNGDQVYINDDYYDSFGYYGQDQYDFFDNPRTDGGQLTITVLDANTVRVNLNELPSAPANIKLKNDWVPYLNLWFDGWLTLPGNKYDASAGFPYKGVARGTSANNEYVPANYLFDWPNADVSVTGVLIDGGGRKILKPKALTSLLTPPPASFTGLIDSYCASSSVVNLVSRFPDDGTFSVVPNFGLVDGGPSNATATFDPGNAGIVLDDTTKITYTVTDIKGCTNFETQWTIVHSLPTADAGLPSAEVCYSISNPAPVQIGGSPTASSVSPFSPGFTYVWSPSLGLDAFDVPNPKANPSANQPYTVTVTDSYGCQDTDVITVNAFNPATANAGNDVSICSDGSIDLTDATGQNGSFGGGAPSAVTEAYWNIQGGATGTFKDAGGNPLSAPYTKDIAASYTPSASEIASLGFYLLLTTEDPTGPCPAFTDAALVQINQDPSAPALSNPAEVCVLGAVPNLNAPDLGYEVRWYSDPALNTFLGASTSLSSGISNARDTIATFYATQKNLATQCEGSSSSYTIVINPKPTVSFTAQNFCVGDATNFDGSASTVVNNPATGRTSTITSYQWDFKSGGSLSPGIGAISNASDLGVATGTYDKPSKVFTNINTTYDVTLTVNTNDGCSNIIKFTDQDFTPLFASNSPMRIGDTPKANFSYTKICEGDITTFTDNSTVAVADAPLTYAWDFGDGNTDVISNPTNQYLTFGEYDVQLIASTKLDCKDTIVIQVPILPYVSTFPYNADFDTNNNGFVAQAVASIYPGISSWQWNTPNGTVINSDASITGSGNSWFTRVDSLGTYIKNERSALYGPCIDVSALERPVLSFDLWNNTDEGDDGAYVEVAEPNPATGTLNWIRLGDLSSGKNWYNKGLIRGLTEAGTDPNKIGQAVGQIGWSGNTDGWITARYALDDFRDKTKLMVRIVFGSNEFEQSKDGFAVDNFKLSSRNRKILVENFTVSRTAPASPINFETENDNFYSFKNSLTEDEIVKVQYHTNLYPNFTDLINKENPADPNARVGFYGVTNTSIPRVYLDGTSEQPGDDADNNDDGNLSPPLWANNRFGQRTLDDAKFEMYIKTIPSALPGTITVVDSLVALEFIPAAFGKPILHTMILEIEVDGDSSIVRKMLPTAAGSLLEIPAGGLNVGEFIRDTLTWQVDNENLGADLALVAFVQDQITKEVYQSVINFTVDNLPTSITDVEDPDYANKISIYPNPTSREVNIVLPADVTKATPVKLFDSYGKTVNQTSFNVGQRKGTIDTTDLANGMYVIKIATPGGGVAIKKVMVVH